MTTEIMEALEIAPETSVKQGILGINLILNAEQVLAGPILVYANEEKSDGLGVILLSRGASFFYETDYPNCSLAFTERAACVMFNSQGFINPRDGIPQGDVHKVNGLSLSFKWYKSHPAYWVEYCGFPKEFLWQEENSKIKIFQGWDAIQTFFLSRKTCYREVAHLIPKELWIREQGCELFKIVSQGESFYRQRLDVELKKLSERVAQALLPKKED